MERHWIWRLQVIKANHQRHGFNSVLISETFSSNDEDLDLSPPRYLFFSFLFLATRTYTPDGIKIIYILKSGASACAAVRRYFLAPCDKRINTLATPSSRPPATPARIPLGDTLCGYRTVVSVSSAL